MGQALTLYIEIRLIMVCRLRRYKLYEESRPIRKTIKKISKRTEPAVATALSGKEIVMGRFIKTFALCVVLSAYLCCSGCATILGGIIGYQSGELGAGLAIWAALDFGGDIVNGVGQLLTDKEVRFEQKVSLDTEEGKIDFSKSDFSAEKMERLMRKLEKKFEQNGWSYTMVQKKRYTGRTLLSEKWRCKDGDDKEF